MRCALPKLAWWLQLLVSWLIGYEVGCAPPKLAWWLSNWQLENQEVSCKCARLDWRLDLLSSKIEQVD